MSNSLARERLNIVYENWMALDRAIMPTVTYRCFSQPEGYFAEPSMFYIRSYLPLLTITAQMAVNVKQLLVTFVFPADSPTKGWKVFPGRCFV